MTSKLAAAASRTLASVLALGVLASGPAATAQTYPPPAGGYYPQQGPQQGQYPPPADGGDYQDQGQPPAEGGYPANGQPPPYAYDQRAAPEPQGQYPRGRYAPPPGQYAPPPTGSGGPGAVYDPRAQQYDRDYAERYAGWAQQNCIDQRNNTIAGALIGGAIGAIAGAGVAGHHSQGAGALVGGALGATAGAAVGSSSGAACPPGYVVRSGAPAFAYAPPYGYGYDPPTVIYGPGWYDPWVWYGGHWVYRPYRDWYWHNRGYWGPGYRPGPGYPYGHRHW